MLALALVMEGKARTEAAISCGMDRQTLRDWVHRYNAEGLEGLLDRHRSGRRRLLTAAQEAEIARLVEAGPDLETHGVVRWRCVDLQKVIAERFEVDMAERTVGKLLKKLEFTRLSPRPFHPKKDAEAQEAFKKLRLLRERTAACRRPGQASGSLVPG
jgi:transposase